MSKEFLETGLQEPIEYKVIDGPKTVTLPWQEPHEQTVFEYKDAHITRQRHNKTGVSWSSAFIRDIPQIDQAVAKGGDVVLPAHFYVYEREGMIRASHKLSVPFSGVDMQELFNQTIEFLELMGVDLPKPDPKFQRLESLLSVAQDSLSIREDESLKKGDCVAQYQVGVERLLLNVGEVDSYGVSKDSKSMENFALRRGQNLAIRELRFKKPLFFIAYDHYTPTEQHITGVFLRDLKMLVSRGATAGDNIIKIYKEDFDRIKEEAEPLIKEE